MLESGYLLLIGARRRLFTAERLLEHVRDILQSAQHAICVRNVLKGEAGEKWTDRVETG